MLLSVAAILGDTVNYAIGHYLGPKVFHFPKSRFFNPEHLRKTHAFYEKYGGKTIIIARFVPIVRTFAPFVAGIGAMSYARFLAYNVIGGLLWVAICLFAGYFFGNLPFVKKNFSLVIIAIVLLSILPAVVEYLRHRREAKRAAVRSRGLTTGGTGGEDAAGAMEPLKIGITGVRGVVGQTLTPELVVRFAEAFGSYLDGGRVLVCRDPRPSGPMVQAAVTAGLLSVGCEVVDLGVCPTPTLQLAVSWLGAKGGVSITGGHNPPEWNALKFVRGDGLYLSAIQGEELLDVFHQGAVERAPWDRLATRVEEQDAVPHHLEALLPRFDTAAIRARRLRVAVDCGNGSCARLVPRWLAELGCEVLPINDDPSLPFPRLPEPSVATAAQARRSCSRATPTSASCSTPTASG